MGKRGGAGDDDTEGQEPQDTDDEVHRGVANGGKGDHRDDGGDDED
jgi:hypothetical protein